MSTVVVTMFVSVDGFTEAPEKWSLKHWSDEIGAFKHDEIFAADALLLGRVTYQGFADSWPSRPGDFADRINGMPKYVVSSTPLLPLTWQHSTLIPANSDMVDALTRLRRAPGGDLLVYGGSTMVDTLLQHDLVDEFRLLVFPLILGSGKRLFNAGHSTKLTLVDTKTRTFSSGAVLLTYTRRQ